MDSNADAKSHPYNKHNLDLRRFGFEFVSVDLNRGEMVLKHPGVDVRDFDLDKQPKIWVMMGWTIQAQSFAQNQIIDDETKKRFQYYRELHKDRLIFSRASKFEFTKAMYDNNISKRPLIMKVFGGYIGGTSWTSCVEVKAISGDLLLTNTNQYIGVDYGTRKPISLPDWFRERYTNSFKGEPLRFNKFKRPQHVRYKTMRVHWTDLDANIHATWYAYVMMTINSASLLFKEGSLRHFRNNKCNGVQKLELHFYGESLEGEELEVYVWEESNKRNIMKSEICKEGESIFQAMFQFFDS